MQNKLISSFEKEVKSIGDKYDKIFEKRIKEICKELKIVLVNIEWFNMGMGAYWFDSYEINKPKTVTGRYELDSFDATENSCNLFEIMDVTRKNRFIPNGWNRHYQKLFNELVELCDFIEDNPNLANVSFKI